MCTEIHNSNSLIRGLVQITENFGLKNVYIFNGAYSIFYLRGGWSFFFFPVVLEKKIITNSYFTFFYVYMSKCRQFEGLSTGIFTSTIPNHTIKLQLHRPRHLIFEQKNK